MKVVSRPGDRADLQRALIHELAQAPAGACRPILLLGQPAQEVPYQAVHRRVPPSSVNANFIEDGLVDR
jgi:hypothetical protein